MDKPGEGVKLGPVEKIPLGQGLCFIVEGEEIAVFRPRGRSLCAIQNRCPHRQGPLSEGVTDGQQVVCPYHGHKFDLTTGQGSENGERVQVYSVREDNGEVVWEKKQ